jgi:hypothetical protein
MAVLTYSALTLAELAKRTHNGQIQTIAEVLSKTNAILKDAPYIQANGETSHTTTVRTSLPTGTFRKINEGVTPSVSTTKQVVENIAMLEDYSRVDAALVELASDPAAFRLTEDVAFLEGLNQTVASAIFYSTNAGSPEKFKGLAARVTSASASNAVDAGGSGSDLTSVWVVKWGPKAAYLIYPKNHRTFGLQMTDKGKVTTYDSNLRLYEAYITHWQWFIGLVVEDDRCIQRICNIETSGTSHIFDEDYLIQAINKLPSTDGAVIYVNKTIGTQMDIIAKDKSNVQYSVANVFGEEVTTFRGLPVRKCEAILDTETALS